MGPSASDELTVHRRAAPRHPHGGVASLVAAALAVVALTSTTVVALGAVHAPVASATVVTPTHPYAGGGVLPFGDAQDYGSPTTTLASFITGMAATPDGKGYWLVAADGGVFAYGDAPFEGSLGALRLSGPVVGMAATPDGKGYWLAALDGGVFAFGDAAFYGSMGGGPLDQPIVGMAATADGKGYWLVAADGGIFSFGDAVFWGSMGGLPLASAVTGMAATPDGKGYWLVAGDGGIFAFGDAPFLGSGGGKPLPASIAGIASTPDGQGYWMVGNNGSVDQFADAHNWGSTELVKPLSPVTAIVPTPDGKGYWLLEPDDWDYAFSDPSPYALPSSTTITAMAESQVGPDTANAGGAYCNPYGPCEPWCALFATWVWEQAGIPVPSLPFTGSIFTWAARNSRLLPSTAMPAPGDALLFGTGPANVNTSVHTGIVVAVWPDGAVITVEGDAGPAPDGSLAIVVNGPFLVSHSATYNGFPVYAIAQP
jgi:hypothetical protein